MNVLELTLTGSDITGWVWRVQIDGAEVFRTMPLARDDLAVALLSVQRDETRENPLFRNVSDEELFTILDGFFFGSLHDALRPAAEDQTWAKHLVSPAVPTEVCSRMYLVGAHEPDEDRLLVSGTGRPRSFRFPAGEFDKQLRRTRSVLT